MYVFTFYLETPPEDNSGSLSDLLQQNGGVKPTKGAIISAMKLNHLNPYTKPPISSLTVSDTLGEGKIVFL